MFAKRAMIEKGIAATIRNGYLDRFPGIRAYHLKIQSELGRSRTMTTPLGRRRTFFGMWGEQLFRAAYAYKPQSTVADTLNLALIRLCRKYPETRFMLQNHDAFTIQCPRQEVEMWRGRIAEAFNIETIINGKKFVLPIDFKIGNNWDEVEKVEE